MFAFAVALPSALAAPLLAAGAAPSACPLSDAKDNEPSLREIPGEKTAGLVLGIGYTWNGWQGQPVGLPRGFCELPRPAVAVYAIPGVAPQLVPRAGTQWKLAFNVVVAPGRERLRGYGVFNPTGGPDVPSTCLMDGEGSVRCRHIGTSAADRPDVREVLEAVRNSVGAAEP